MGLRLRDVAQRACVSLQAVQKYETGEISLTVDRLHQLSEALGVHITWFFDAEESENVAA